MYGSANVQQLKNGVKALVIAGIGMLMLSQFIEAWLTAPRRIVLFRRWDGAFLQGALVGLALWVIINPKPVSNPFIYFRF